jgi:hypothetical protein
MPTRTKQPARAAPAPAAAPARRVRQAPVRSSRETAVRPTRNGKPGHNVRTAASRVIRRSTTNASATRASAPRTSAQPANGTTAQRATRPLATRTTARHASARPAGRTVARRPIPRPVKHTAARPERQAPQIARRVREVARAPEDQQPPTCVHEWVIEPPNGPTSQGKCRRCGEVRAFRNSLDITYWDTQRHGAGAQRRKPAATPAPLPARRA